MMTRVTSEDVTGIDFRTHPAEVDFTTFGGRSVANLPPRAIPELILRDIERAVADRGYRHGVTAVTVEVIRDAAKRTHLRARITYA
jgi:hypothetical protein